MTLDMYSEKVAEASALIREFAKVDYFHYFARDPESSLEEFIAMLDQAEEKGRQSQAARIAELERQIVEVQAECIKRGADLLERQLAAPSAPAVEQQPVAVIQQINEVNRTAVVTVTASNHWNIDVAIGDRLYAAPQAADTDKVREALNGLHDHIMNLPCKVARAVAMHGATEQAYKEGHRDARHAAAELAASMAAQAPVREVPEGWRLVPEQATEAMYHAGQDVPEPRAFGAVYRAMLAAAPLPAAPVQQEGDRG